ncbi:MAG TPA: hypothetical protein VG734_25405 [Lacunisphaera sp.]|nr:hypothetical protein [Lacunisphaera sp.]
MSITPETPAPATAVPAKEDTTVALLAYLTPLLFGVGIVIAIIMHSNKKTAIGAYHLRQSLGLLLTGLASWIPCIVIGMIPIINFIMLIVGPLLALCFFVFWIMGLLAAINGQMKPLPVVGEYYQKFLANAFT